MPLDFTRGGESFDMAQDPEVLEGLVEPLRAMSLKNGRWAFFISLLEAIDGVYEMTQSSKVFSIEVHDKSRQMGKLRFV